uniref:Uncharacterized protein n=1 Tax=Chromera velia CCMP2878 TaxID=1169474 RepID=A0A0G4HIL6_9ALVE|eukprot:Cvel_27984.t1-p1 / transcript=Cvel_27984.t1 / gene=Cvel_27984 / organism=Chromera_velia_CCMP2878 / gene_product=hypothetical protein / transcript_product=hypothetical protein / location=Cvel_scaffold3581:15097-15465(-) / protein_length=123 / sequence_SO=supercontig / SO=protein_coding / is_pseudo=false
MEKEGFCIPSDFWEKFVVGAQLQICHALLSDVKFIIQVTELRELSEKEREDREVEEFEDDRMVVFRYLKVIPPTDLPEEKKKKYTQFLRDSGTTKWEMFAREGHALNTDQQPLSGMWRDYEFW